MNSIAWEKQLFVHRRLFTIVTMHDELEAYLSQSVSQDIVRVEEVIKESVYEITQRVVFVLPDGTEQGPYIRKIIDVRHGVGFAYKTLYEHQQLQGPCRYVPYIHECMYKKNSLIVVMDYVQGITLEQFIAACGPSVDVAMQYMPQICDAVQALHESFEAPLIHRDLKPSNIMISAHGVMLLDFGIARTFQQDAQQDTVYFGTKLYAPPEQYGFGQTSVKSDTYALGVILAYCITGNAKAATNSDCMARYHVPLKLRHMIARATAFDPKERFNSVRDFKHAFQCSIALYRARKRYFEAPMYLKAENQTVFQGISPYTWLRFEPSFVERMMDRVPYVFWVCWNMVVTLLYVLSIASIVQVYMQALGDGPPLWVATLFFMGYCMVVVHFLYFQLLYKRRLFRRLDRKGVTAPSFLGTPSRRWVAVIAATLAGYISMLMVVVLTQLADMGMHVIWA